MQAGAGTARRRARHIPTAPAQSGSARHRPPLTLRPSMPRPSALSLLTARTLGRSFDERQDFFVHIVNIGVSSSEAVASDRRAMLRRGPNNGLILVWGQGSRGSVRALPRT